VFVGVLGIERFGDGARGPLFAGLAGEGALLAQDGAVVVFALLLAWFGVSGCACARCLIVDLAVAVVVFSVAHFGDGHDLFCTATPQVIAFAVLDTLFAGAYVDGFFGSSVTDALGSWTATAIDPIIDFAVAVVVFFVTHFGDGEGLAGACTPGPVAFTVAGTWTARKDAFCEGWPIVAKAFGAGGAGLLLAL
jgi:hypothetical protein